MFLISEKTLFQSASNRLQNYFVDGSVLAGSLLAGADCAGTVVAGVAGAVAAALAGVGASASAGVGCGGAAGVTAGWTSTGAGCIVDGVAIVAGKVSVCTVAGSSRSLR
jgi:ABC-type dipeptide/oligopeptide/nickel transport system permease subunit